jgi:hypothetical protein
MWNAEFSVVSFNNFERNFMRFSKVNFCVILWYFKKNILENVEFLSSFPALPSAHGYGTFIRQSIALACKGGARGLADYYRQTC